MILFNKIYFTQYVNISNYDKIIIGLYKVKGPQPLLTASSIFNHSTLHSVTLLQVFSRFRLFEIVVTPKRTGDRRFLLM